MTRRRTSLKWPLIVQPLIIQFFVLFASFLVLMAVLLRLDSGGHYTEQTLSPIVAEAVVRRTDGGLSVKMTPRLRTLHALNPSMWFVAEDRGGSRVRFGTVPAQYASLAGSLRGVAWADLRDNTPPYRLAAVIREENGPVGRLTIMGHGKLHKVSWTALMAANIAVVPIFLMLGAVTVILTPLIVRRSLIGMSRIAKEAEQIDVERGGIRLPEAEAPRELVPLVRAVNEALERLDEGHRKQQRFIVSAAHELRTPIAILRAKIDANAAAPARGLANDVARLANLAEQLLDLHRLETEATSAPVDLAVLVRSVAADLAPLMIEGSRTIEVQVEHAFCTNGDAAALGRVLTNLIQNAVEHGGRRVIARVVAGGFEVEDDGPGIPVEERARVFEPFHRVRARSTGTGLGLNLVHEVVARHGGRATILDAPGGGAIVRVELPPA